FGILPSQAPNWMAIEPSAFMHPLLDPALLDLLIDHSVQVVADSFDIQPLRQRLLLLHAVQGAFHDVRRVKARRIRTWRKLFERRHELEDLFIHSVDTSNVI